MLEGSHAHRIEANTAGQGTAGQKWFAGLPGAFQEHSLSLPAPPGSSQSALFNLQVAAAAARAGLAPSAASAASPAALSWPKPSMPTISAQPGDFCFDYCKKRSFGCFGFKEEGLREVRGSVWSPTPMCSAYLCSLLGGLEVFHPNQGIYNFPVVLICAKLCREDRKSVV